MHENYKCYRYKQKTAKLKVKKNKKISSKSSDSKVTPDLLWKKKYYLSTI